MESKYRRLGKNTFIVFIGSVGSRLINFVMLPFYTHYLSTEQYGVSDIINTYSLILLPLITCCIADGIFIFPKTSDLEGKKKYFTSGIIFACSIFILAIPLLVLAQYLLIEYMPWNSISDNIWWVYLMTLCFFLQRYTQQFTMSIDKMKAFSSTGVVLTFALAFFSIILIPRYGLVGYLISIIVSNFIASVFTFVISGSYKYISIKAYDRASLRRLLAYGVPLIPNSIMWWLVSGLNRPVMENSIGLSAVGIFAVASKFPSVVTMIFNVFSNAWTVSLIEEFGKPDFNKFFNQILKMITLIVVIIGMIIMFFSQMIISIFASPDFYDAWHYLPILVISVCLENVSCMIGGVFSAMKKSKYFFLSSLWGAGISTILTLSLVKTCGMYGICIAVAISFFCMVVVRLKFAWKFISEFSAPFYIFILLLMCAFAAIIISNHGILINTIALGFILLILTFCNKNEIKKIIIKIKNR